MGGNCLEAGIVYEAEVDAEGKPIKKYLGSTATTFKVRHGNHKSDLKHNKKRFATKLSGYVWNLKDQEINHNIRWKIKKKAKPYNPTTKMCNLCLTEMEADRSIYLNDRTEILAKCRHANKYKLESLLK